jgi:hypothetical protein
LQPHFNSALSFASLQAAEQYLSPFGFVPQSAACTRCLVLVAYSDDVTRELVLPLPEPSAASAALPGAPLALFDDVPYIVDDTRKIQFSAIHSPTVRAEMQKYFASKESSFRSFASLRVIVDGKPAGVVNLDCSEVNIFGKEESDKVTIAQYLFPFCSAIGILLRKSG